MMHRALVFALMLSSITAPLGIDAQQTKKLYRIGMLAWIIHERSFWQPDGLKWTVAARCGVDE